MTKKRAIFVILILAALYVVWPFDLLPLNPADDLVVLAGSLLTSAGVALLK